MKEDVISKNCLTLAKILGISVAVSVLASCKATMPSLGSITNNKPVTTIPIDAPIQVAIEDVIEANMQSNHQGVRANLSASLVKRDATGTPLLLPLTHTNQVQSGDVILYQATFTNESNERVGSMNVDLNIPKGVNFLGFEHAIPQPAFASADGIRFLHAPILANVNGVRKTLPLSHYKSLRWVVENIASGASKDIKFQVRVK